MGVRELFDEFQRAEVHLCVGYGKATMIYGRGPLQTEFVLFLEAVRVHTVFPLSDRSHEQADLEKTALRYYPLAGALIAAIAAFTWLIAGGILPVEIASTIAIAASLLISGAKQEDGARKLGGEGRRPETLPCCSNHLVTNSFGRPLRNAADSRCDCPSTLRCRGPGSNSGGDAACI